MKKVFVLCLLAAIAANCFVLYSACSGKSEVARDFSEVVFESVTVDVKDQPDYYARVFDFNVKKVTVDGEKLNEENYTVKNGYFAFAYQNYKSMGLGTHNIKVFFNEGERTFDFTVTDVRDADFSLGFALPDGAQIGAYNLPKAIRNNAFQDYVIDYELKYNGEKIDMNDDGEDFSYAFEEVGQYDYIVKVFKNGNITEYKYPFTITDKYGFSPEMDYAVKGAYQAFNGSYNDEKGCIVGYSGGYLTIDGGLISRAKYSG